MDFFAVTVFLLSMAEQC